MNDNPLSNFKYDYGDASERVDKLRKGSHLKDVAQKIRSTVVESVDNQSIQQQRFERMMRDGVAVEIRNAILEVRRELDQHEKMGRFSKTSLEMANEFRRFGEGFLQRKILLEKVENGIEELRSKISNGSTPSLELKLNQAVYNANKIKDECIIISDKLVVLRERVDQQVSKDQIQEQTLKQTMERCLNQLPKQERGKLMVNINHKIEKLPIENRLTFFSQLIQQFARKIPAIREEEVERLCYRAKQLAKTRSKEALHLIDKIFQFDKEYIPAHRLRAEIFHEMGNKIAYICELRMIIKIDLAEARDFNVLGEVLYASGQIDEAYGLFEDTVSKDPCPKFLERLGDVAMEMKRWFRAIQVYQQILKQTPHLARVMHKYGKALLENSREDEAFDVLREAIQIKDDSAESRVCVGRIYRRRSAYQEAYDSFKKAVALDDHNIEAYYWWGAMLLDRGEFEDALSNAEKLVELDSKRTRNRLLLARCMASFGRHKEACETLVPCLSAKTPSVDLLLTYSEMSRNSGNEEKAIEILGEFVKRFPRQPQIRAEYGVLLVQVGRFEEANQYLEPGSAFGAKISA